MRTIVQQLLIALAALSFVTSCRSAKEVPTTTTTTTTPTAALTGDQRAAAIAGAIWSWKTLQVSGKVRLNAGSDFSSSMQLRMERGKFINISLRPVLGIEVGRLLVTNDSIFVIDKVHKRYVAESLSLLIGGLPVTVADAQDLFLGRAFVLGEGTLSKANQVNADVNNNGDCTLKPRRRQAEFTYQFDYDRDNHIKSLEVTPTKSSATTYHVDYADVKATAAGDIAHRLKAASRIEGRDMELQLEYNNISWDPSFKVDTSIPSNYKRMEASQLLNLF